MEALADDILRFNLEVIKTIAERFPRQVHGIWFTEDWGTQQALMIRPSMWREFFRPRYEAFFEAVHDLGLHIWLHSDGHINAIINDLIDVGVDLLNLQQPRVNGIEGIGESFAGQIRFETLCDIQKTLPSKSREEIAKEACLLLEHWTTASGGLILSIDEDKSVLSFPSGNIEYMLDVFLESDPWN